MEIKNEFENLKREVRVFAIKDENGNYVDKSSFTFKDEYFPYPTINRVDLHNSLDEAKEVIRKLNSHIKLHIVEINPITEEIFKKYKM